MHWSLAAAAIFVIAAAGAPPADAARKRGKSTAGGQGSTHVDSVDLNYVAGHGSPSQIHGLPPQKRVPRRLRAR
jgi:hypothetical protein